MTIIPKLQPLNLFDNDILFSQGDLAEEIFFVLHGKVLLLTDITDVIDFSLYLTAEVSFNVPISVYSDGSYFGDNDVLFKRQTIR